MNRTLTLAATLTALTALHLAPSAQAQSPAQPGRSPSTLTTSPTPRPPAPNTTTINYSAPPQQATSNSQGAAPLALATDPAYKLAIGDELSVDVYGESDMSAAQRLDQQGNVRLPHLNEVNLAAKTVREAESFLEQLYIDKKLLKKPLVTINVRVYASRQVTIIGSVNSPGIFTLPRETDSIEIVELITSIGGFRPTAKSDAVRVTRTDSTTGKEMTSYVDVDAMIYNKRNAQKTFKIYPGDRVLVTERLW